ncbi:uncharacterized protein EI90DRAFT_3014671 [Cantharellus anzutake]|uniref:uncharacterized protein n=1 Tax=Cantharellus anzutake TaxID=1750568 RepID=UPI00190627A4|nr:uncharacterized protein EI90DRAFT_3014671 [Cantharellus anzutake]KAF8335425.1 hypothetical protein EI90DRAFT_3014671 [Cantharellus anzutake]
MEWTGWSGWAGGRAIIYASDAVRIENVVDLDGDLVAGKRKMSEKMLAAQKEYRDRCPPVIIEYYNPRPMRCCREVVCSYYVASEYAKKSPKMCGTTSVQLAKDTNDLPKYDKEMIGLGLKNLMDWREDVWARRRAEAKLSHLDPPNFIVTGQALSLLVSVIHQATMESRTLEILDQWINILELDLSDEEKLSLIPVVSACNSWWNAKRKQTKAQQKEAEMKKSTAVRKRSRVQVAQDDGDEGLVLTREMAVEPVGKQRASVAMRVFVQPHSHGRARNLPGQPHLFIHSFVFISDYPAPKLHGNYHSLNHFFPQFSFALFA